MKTTDARKLNQETPFELRKQVVRLKEKGKNNAEISKIVGLSQSHISTIWQKYQRGGLDAIKPGVRGRRHGEQRELSAEQEAGLHKLLVDSQIVKDWLAENKEKIEVFYLPSYSPELNPYEYLNGDLKHNIRSGLPARSLKELTKKTRSFMRKLQNRPEHVRNYFQHPKIAYAA